VANPSLDWSDADCPHYMGDHSESSGILIETGYEDFAIRIVPCKKHLAQYLRQGWHVVLRGEEFIQITLFDIIGWETFGAQA